MPIKTLSLTPAPGRGDARRALTVAAMVCPGHPLRCCLAGLLALGLATGVALAARAAAPGPAVAEAPAPWPAAAAAAADAAAAPLADAAAWRRRFDAAVVRRLLPPPEAQQALAALARPALQVAEAVLDRPQFVLVVDRAANVQAALLYLAGPGDAPWQWVGAVPVATGRPGGFEHFLTPTGAFAHHLGNPDFRAEGTRNELGVRGYGVQGLRLFDFGWVIGERTWGDGGRSPMRLQLHATDPDLLEPRLGQRGSKGCVRVPAEFNRLLDQAGLLDADYDAALAHGERLWLFDAPRQPEPQAGRWLVVVDSGAAVRPDWARPPPMPARPAPAKRPQAARAPGVAPARGAAAAGAARVC